MESILWFLIIGILFFVMMRFGCGAHIGGHGGGHGHTGPAEGTSGSSSGVKDPVCGMEIEKEKAYAKIRRDEKDVYFCSKTCQKKFNENPKKYF